MDQRLNDAAQAGDIEALYALIQQDPFVLENVDNVPFSHTPLHVAILAQQTRFAKEVASLKPSFAGKLNQDGLSPTHLATVTGQVEMVKELLTINPKLCLLKGKEKRIPLHYAAAAGTVNVMEKLLWHCPESILELTIRNETAIHIAAKENKLEAFKMLLEWLEKLYIEEEVDRSALEIALKSVNSESLRALVGRVKLLNKDDFRERAYSFGLKKNEVEDFQNIRETLKKIRKEEVLNWKDDEGNTVLHLIATFSKNRQMINLMIGQDSINRWEVDVNATNARGQTALDVLSEDPQEEERDEIENIERDVIVNIPLEERDEIENILSEAGAKTAREVINHLQSSSPNAPTRGLRLVYRPLTWKDYLRFQSNKVSPSDVRNALLVVAVLIATATFQAGVSPPGGVWQDDNIPNYSNKKSSLKMVGRAGTAILAKNQARFFLFVIVNEATFLLSLSMIDFLTEGFPFQYHLRVALLSMFGTYFFSTFSITPIELHFTLTFVFVVPVVLVCLFKAYITLKAWSLIS